MFCESCCDGGDLAPGEMCPSCGTSRIIVGTRPLEYPMTKEEEGTSVPVTKLPARNTIKLPIPTSTTACASTS